MSSDGRLPSILPKKIPDAHWVRVESGEVAAGTPDLNVCLEGREVWVECKATIGWHVPTIRKAQVAWLERRERAGGLVFVAVRQQGAKRDNLWLLKAGAARLLLDKISLASLHPDYIAHFSSGGPEQWGWPEIKRSLFESRRGDHANSESTQHRGGEGPGQGPQDQVHLA